MIAPGSTQRSPPRQIRVSTAAHADIAHWLRQQKKISAARWIDDLQLTLAYVSHGAALDKTLSLAHSGIPGAKCWQIGQHPQFVCAVERASHMLVLRVLQKTA